MALADILNAVGELLPGTKNLIGAEHIGAHEFPPRIVWVPTTDRFGPARQHQKDNPRAIRTRLAGVVAHVWAKGDGTPHSDHAATEQLVNDLIAAVHQVAYGSYDIGEGNWLGQEGGELTHLGRGYLLPFTFHVPITLTPFTKAPVDTVVATSELGT